MVMPMSVLRRCCATVTTVFRFVVMLCSGVGRFGWVFVLVGAAEWWVVWVYLVLFLVPNDISLLLLSIRVWLVIHVVLVVR